MTKVPTLSDADLNRRRLTVAEYFLVWEDGDDDSPSLRDQLIERRGALREDYLDVLPTITLSRCPFTGDAVERAVDVVDLDGMYWEARSPTRRPGEAAPPSLIAITGAVRIREPVAWAPFLAKPGPEAPFVRPDVLRHDGSVAVLSDLRIGPHTGYPIVYFFDPSMGAIPDELRLNEWGTERFRVLDSSGVWRWGSELDDESAYDYDIEPWIEAGKLAWIEPGDRELTVRFGLDGCPFVGLDGHRAVTRIEEGDVWWPEDVLGSSGG